MSPAGGATRRRRARPVMDVIAGPPGSGKSTFFPVRERPHDGFNVDERRRELHPGPPATIPAPLREQVRLEYEAFIHDHIEDRRSFAFEATLARDITFRQAEMAREYGFRLSLTYVAAPLEVCLTRVAARVLIGGHGSSEATLRAVWAASVANLVQALGLFDWVHVHDTSSHGLFTTTLEQARPRRVLHARAGRIVELLPDQPAWLTVALAGSPYDSPS